MLNMEPQPDILDLLNKLQESTTEDIDEERGSFKKGDEVTYNMFGSGLTNSDLIRTLDTNEHATRVIHNGTVAKIVETIGEEVSRYSIMFEDGFIINDVAVSELKSVDEMSRWTRAADTDEQEQAIVSLERSLKELGKNVCGGTTIGRSPQTVILDLTHQGGEIYINSEGEVEVNNTVVDPADPESIKDALEESKTNEAEDATDTMKPQEKPNINAEDYHMEDYSEEDLNKPDAKVKSKSEETGNAIRPVEDDELEQKEDKVVTPKKESKLKEAKDVLVTITGGEDEGKSGLVSKWVKGLGYQDVGFEGKTKQISYEYLKVGDKPAVEFDKEVEVEETKTNEEETEFTPSRSEVSKISDEKLRELYNNARRSLEYWKEDGTVPEKVELTRKAVERYEEMMIDRDLMSKEDTIEKKESKFSFMKKQDPLWLCNECFKTFRSNKSVCTLCESTEVEKIAEQSGVGFTKEVFQVTWKNTDTGKEESTRVMAFDEADAKKEATRPSREITKVEGPITKEAKKEEESVPFDQNEDVRQITPGRYLVTFYDGTQKEVDADSLVDAKGKGEKAFPEKRVSNVKMIRQVAAKQMVTASKNKEEDKISFDESLEGVKKIGTADMLKRIKSWLQTDNPKRLKQYYKRIFHKEVNDRYLDTIPDMIMKEIQGKDQKDITNIWWAFSLIANPVSESKLHEHVRELVGELPGIDAEERARLYQALDDGDISDEWPDNEDMIDALSTKNVQMGAADLDDLDMGDIKAVYLKYILLPRARKATAAPLASESKIDEQEEEGIPEEGKTYLIHQKLGMGLLKGTYKVTNVENRKTVKGDLAKQFQVADNDEWWIAKFYGFKEVANESKVDEQEEDWDLSFMYAHNLIWHNPMVDREGNHFIWQKQRIAGKRVRVFTDYQADWAERNKAVPVKVDYEPISEAKKIKPIRTIEIVRSQLDPEAYNIRVVELPEGSIEMLDSVSDEKEAIRRGKEFARQLNAKFLGIIDESKLKEQEEENTFKTIAKGIEDRTDADKLAREKEGQVVQDDEDEKKFAVIVKEE